MITRLLHGLTDASSSRRGSIVTILIWLVLAGVLVMIAPQLASIYNNDVTQSIPSSADSQAAQRLLQQEFPSSRGTPAIVVFSDSHGLSTEDRTHIQTYYTWLSSKQSPSAVGQIVSVFNIPQAASQLVSEDKTTMMLLVNLHGSTSSADFTNAVQALRTHLQDTVADTSLQAHLTGPAGIVVDAVKIFSNTDLPLLLTTIGLVLVLLILLYRSPLLALYPLLAVGWAMQIANALVGLAAQAGWFGVSQQATSIMTVLLFGAGTDYTIFIASRFREELMHTEDKYLAMRQTMRAVGEAITSSAGTVILALLTLIFATIGLYSSLGPTLAIAIVVMLLAGLTLAPALLVLVGRVAFWPLMPRFQTEPASKVDAPRGFWGHLGQWTARHRKLAVMGSTLLLVVMALGNIGTEPTFNFLTAFRAQTDSGSGYTVLQDHYPAGTLAPTTVLLQFHGSDKDAYQQFVLLDDVTAALQQVNGVATVEGPTRPAGQTSTTDPAALQKEIDSLPLSLREAIRNGTASGLPTCQGAHCPPPDFKMLAAIEAYGATISYISPDNTTVQLSVVFKTDPYALHTIDEISSLRSAVNQALDTDHASGSVTVHLAGQTSLLADTLGYNQRDTLLLVPVVLLLVGLILGLLLRSIVAAVYLLAAVTLNFLATIGICSFFFLHIQGQDGFNYAIPLYTFIFLVALGADYTIFLMSRVREEGQRRGLEAGVPFAVSRTGGVITSAGLILAGTFAALTSLPLNILYQFGICVAVGILLDTFVVRGLLVPGLVLLLGKWNWWPGKLTPLPASVQEATTSQEVSVPVQPENA